MKTIKDRFRGFLPVVIDVETGGFNPKSDALLELAAVFLDLDKDNRLTPTHSQHFHIEPFANSNIEEASLKFLGLDPYHPFRFSVPEQQAIEQLNQSVREKLQHSECTRAILVGHNASFDLSFLLAAFQRLKVKNPPFHSFSTLDTATLSAVAFGQTVLAKALQAAGISFNPEQAHGALYDAEKTAELFCNVVNQWPPH